LLDDLQKRSVEPGLLAELLREWPDGRLKLWVTARALEYREANLRLFQNGKYAPLHGTVSNERHILGFARIGEGKIALTIVPRFPFTLVSGENKLPLGEAWRIAEIVLPHEAANQQLRNVLTGETLRASREHTLRADALFQHFPVALLVNN
jgi:(1->4)-alpha-D-glucan 1-alpha-D-glucosylmutase